MQKIHSARKYIGFSSEEDWLGGFYLDYYMVKSEIKIPGSNIKATVYGVEIEKKLTEDGIEKILEQAEVRDIFATAEHTKTLIARLAAHEIMPSTLEYVIDDLLGERGFEPPEIRVTT